MDEKIKEVVEGINATYFDSEDAFNRTIAVTIHGDKAYLATRTHPSEVWSIPVELHLGTAVKL